MTRRIGRLLIFALVACPSPFSRGLAQTVSADLLQEDFRIMRQALEQAHGGIYRYTSKREMDRHFDCAYRTIDCPMTDLEFWRLLAPVVAQIKCGHTSIWFPKTLQAEFETVTPFLPLEMRVLGDRAYVFQDCASAGSALEGTEVLSINGVPMKKLLNRLRAVITGDGDSTTAKASRISNNGGFTVYLYALGIESPFRVSHRGKDGRRQITELAGLTIPNRTKAYHQAPPNHALQRLT